MLAGGIGRSARSPLQTQPTAGVDDTPTLPGAVLANVLHLRPQTVHDTVDIDSKHKLPILVRLRLDRPDVVVLGDRARQVRRPVQPAELVHRVVDPGVDGVARPHIDRLQQQHLVDVDVFGHGCDNLRQLALQRFRDPDVRDRDFGPVS